MSVRDAIARHKGRTTAAAIVVVVGIGLGIWFGPQHLFFDRRVDESLPGLERAAAATSRTGGGEDPATGGQGPDARGEDEDGQEPPAGPVILAQGTFRSIEHESTGEALLIELPDGGHIVRFEDLDVLSGPDLRVYLAEAPRNAPDDAFGRDFVDLGGLKGNQGNQNYEVPASVDLEDYRSVSVWCRRFSVGFGVADLTPVRA